MRGGSAISRSRREQGLDFYPQYSVPSALLQQKCASLGRFTFEGEGEDFLNSLPELG